MSNLLLSHLYFNRRLKCGGICGMHSGPNADAIPRHGGNARSYFELHTVSPARFIATLKTPATTPSARTLAVQIRTSQPTLRSHVCAPADGCAVISDTPRLLSPFRGIRNRTLRCRRG